MDQLEGIAVLEECGDEMRPAAPMCPLCSESLLVLGGMVRCPRCGLMLCESCDGASGS